MASTIHPDSISSQEQWGVPDIQPQEISSAESFEIASIYIILKQNSILSAENFCAPKLIQIIRPDPIQSGSRFDLRNITHLGIHTGEQFGISRIQYVIKPNSIISGEQWEKNGSQCSLNICLRVNSPL